MTCAGEMHQRMIGVGLAGGFVLIGLHSWFEILSVRQPKSCSVMMPGDGGEGLEDGADFAEWDVLPGEELADG